MFVGRWVLINRLFNPNLYLAKTLGYIFVAAVLIHVHRKLKLLFQANTVSAANLVYAMKRRVEA